MDRMSKSNPKKNPKRSACSKNKSSLLFNLCAHFAQVLSGLKIRELLFLIHRLLGASFFTQNHPYRVQINLSKVW
ncbi:MAG: hypothetical protein CMI28_02465 [Opitutae bacterium]|nr:hypothetical protein [Opitutae bacterium]